MYQIIKRFFFALLIMVGILNVPCAAHAQETQRTRLSVGILAYSPPWYDGAFVDETMRYLSWHLPQYEFDVQFYSPSDLEAKLNSKSVDIIAASAAFDSNASLPPRSIAAFPLLRHNTAQSTVTFGLLS